MELEWIDLETASVDAVLCKWGLMFSIDPEAALREARRVLRPGGRIALAAWDEPPVNPWATIPTRALVELGHIAPPDPDAPGMFILSAPGRAAGAARGGRLPGRGRRVGDMSRSFAGAEDYVDRDRTTSRACSARCSTRCPTSSAQAVAVKSREARRPYTGADGSLTLPGRSLVAAADA